MSSRKLSITNLDFDGIKSEIIAFLKAQTAFSDYDFTGSGLSVLLDILAYNTHFLGYYLSMVANEMFLDSADLRESITSLAKQLNYTPRSRHSSTAVINFTIIPPGVAPATLVVPKNTQFNTTIDSTAYTFVTDKDHSVTLDSVLNRYTLSNIIINEGLPFTFRYAVDQSVPNQRFIIPNPNVDTNQLTVRVQNSATDTTITVFSLADDVNVIDGTTPVYFLQEVEENLYQVYFGDGVLGKPLQDGNIVILDYNACNADAPNSAALFVASQPIGGFGNIQVTTVDNASGGAEREDVESIRFAAPKNFEAQNRAVTKQDYKTILLKNYPNINSLSIWGGEDNDPPIYGKAFISLQPAVGYVITQTTKQLIIDEILKVRNVLTVIPTIIDPDYIFLTINSLVKYNPKLTTLTPDSIKALVINTIDNFVTEQISKFDLSFRFSTLGTLIDATEQSITNNITKITLQKRFIPVLNKTQSQIINFNSNNSITPGTVSSSKFISNPLGFKVNPGEVHGFKDDGLGTLQIFKQIGTAVTVVKQNAGTVDYVNGKITITSFNPASIVDPVSYIRIFATPDSQDVMPIRNQIVTVDPADVTVNMITIPV